MSVLLLRLAGPMQSWGVTSRFSVRDTGLEPSKSGVVGLLAAALGRPRQADVVDLAALSMAVRIDREGRMACDYHTALDVRKADDSGSGTVVSQRYYLADADFLVALEGDTALLTSLHEALQRPVWQLFLGRKSFVPGLPVWLPNGLRANGSAAAAVRAYPWRRPKKGIPAYLRLVLETSPGAGTPRPDVPLSFATRRFGVRHVITDRVETDLLPDEEPTCT
jgi:CRISPR system Cascade subunit CasD